MSEKKVSVVMSVYNETEEELRGAIESILGQTYGNIEFVIVLDNPENEKLKAVILEYQKNDSRVKSIFNDENKGLVYSLNKALEKAEGEYIARMDADDYSVCDRIEKQIRFLEKKELDFVYSGVMYMDESGNSLYPSDIGGLTYTAAVKSMRYKNCSFHPTWLFKKEILDVLKRYHDVPYAEDYDFICRTISKGYKVCGMNEWLLQYRVRASGISNSNKVKQDIMAECIGKEYRKHLSCYSTANVLQEYDKKIRDKKYCIFIAKRYEYGQKYKKLFRDGKFFQGIGMIIIAFIKHPGLMKDIYRKVYLKRANKRTIE